MLTGVMKQYHAFAESLHTRYSWNASLKDSRVTANLRQDTEAWYPLSDDASTVSGIVKELIHISSPSNLERLAR